MAPYTPPDISSELNFDAEVFENTRSIVDMHNFGRFGKTNDMSVLVVGSESQKDDYVVGVLAGSIAIFCVFLVWNIVLLVLHCSGPNRVGLFSGKIPKLRSKPKLHDDDVGTEGGKMADYGAPPAKELGDDVDIAVPPSDADPDIVVPPSDAGPSPDSLEKKEESGGGGIAHAVCFEDEPSKSDRRAAAAPRMSRVEYQDDLDRWNSEVRRMRRKVMWTRIVVLMSAVLVLICTILYVVKGVDSLVGSLNSADDAIDTVINTLNKASRVLTRFVSSQEDVSESTQAVVSKPFAEWCPGLTNYPDETKHLHDGFEYMAQVFLDVKYALVKEVGAIQRDIQENVDIANDLSSTVNSFQWAFYVAAGFGVAFLIVILVIMIEVILAWTEKRWKPFRCMHTWFLMPAFVFCIFLAWLFSLIFVLGAVTSADFCYDSPDDVAKYLLEENENIYNSFLFRFIRYYISGCQEQYKPPNVEDAFDEAVNVLTVTHDFINDLSQEDPQLLSQYCNASVTALNQSMGLIDDHLHIYADVLFGVRGVFFCSSWNPIYSNLLYDALCYNGVDGMAWIFSTQLIIAIFSMLIVTLRVAWHNVEMREEEEQLTADGNATMGGEEFQGDGDGTHVSDHEEEEMIREREEARGGGGFDDEDDIVVVKTNTTSSAEEERNEEEYAS